MIRQIGKCFLLGSCLLRSWLRQDTANWLQCAAQGCSRVIGLEIRVVGELPESGLIVANHLGYLDVIALASVLPCRFAAKADVAAWPVFGAFAKRGKTIFIERQQRTQVAKANEDLAKVLAEPVCTVVFPEGTSSNGRQVLPFHSSLLQPAIDCSCSVIPLGISYVLEEADAGENMAYHSEMTLMPHLWNLFRFKKMGIVLHFGEVRQLMLKRKEEATRLREAVDVLRQIK